MKPNARCTCEIPEILQEIIQNGNRPSVMWPNMVFGRSVGFAPRLTFFLQLADRIQTIPSAYSVEMDFVAFTSRTLMQPVRFHYYNRSDHDESQFFSNVYRDGSLAEVHVKYRNINTRTTDQLVPQINLGARSRSDTPINRKKSKRTSTSKRKY